MDEHNLKEKAPKSVDTKYPVNGEKTKNVLDTKD